MTARSQRDARNHAVFTLVGGGYSGGVYRLSQTAMNLS